MKVLCVFRFAFIKIRFPFRLLIPYGARDFRSATQQAAFSLLANCRQRAVQIVAGSASSVEHDPQRALRKRGRNKMCGTIGAFKKFVWYHVIGVAW